MKNSETVRLSFSEFVHTTLMFQMQKHQEFLDGFTSLFKTVDADMDGVLNEE